VPNSPADATPLPASFGRADLVEYASDNMYKTALVIEHPVDDERCLAYFGARPAGKLHRPADVSLSDHQASVAAKAKGLAIKAGLGSLEETYEMAGNIHDSGKARDVWQRAMGGTADNPLAKTKAPVNLKLIDGYRHELGSVIDAVTGSNSDDLLLHLVASHHAGARPFFEARQYDRRNLTRSGQECPEIARRYARLQARYGPWGLAYLEAVFKCADGMVSEEEGDPESA
jgi:CRISPR-associated endonuclease/helicase Cas3